MLLCTRLVFCLMTNNDVIANYEKIVMLLIFHLSDKLKILPYFIFCCRHSSGKRQIFPDMMILLNLVSSLSVISAETQKILLI